MNNRGSGDRNRYNAPIEGDDSSHREVQGSAPAESPGLARSRFWGVRPEATEMAGTRSLQGTRSFAVLSLCAVVALAAGCVQDADAFGATSTSQQAVTVDADDIGGTVSGPEGPEAGVWVIAETHDLPTRFIRIVVTDDEGRYLIPDLPDAEYDVWVRGYGLVDSDPVRSRPGNRLTLRAVEAPNQVAAAQYYPSGSWFSLIEAPSADQFPGTGPDGNGISPRIETQAEWLAEIKSRNCQQCHQLGNKATREIPEKIRAQYESTEEAWERRLQSGQAGGFMTAGLNGLGREAALRMFADWTDRIEAGEVPPAPPRPEGVERNVVVTLWDWADPRSYLHDVVSTDRRDPTVNAGGPVYGALENSADYVPALDPETHTAYVIPISPRDPDTPRPSPEMPASSPYWGDAVLWTSQMSVHNPMIDQDGMVWLTARVRPTATPDFCREGSDHPSAQVFPTDRAGRHLAMLDPRTEELTHVATCFGTHHLMFAEDDSNTLWTSGGGDVVGWLDTELFADTGDEELAQGWTPLILDTNGNGVRDEWVDVDETVDPRMDKRIRTGFYGVAPATDGSIWASTLGNPGGLVRLVPGEDPSNTALAEFYELPLDDNGVPVEGFSPRGMDVDRNGVVWTPLASGHMASFDRSKCAVLNGPEATGQHCPEGWTFHVEPLPQLEGVETPGSAEASYYTWVDQFNTLGLGENVPINTGNQNEGLLALVDGEWVVMRVPYPLGFYTKWMDGRIDDPDNGWKGRGLWATVSTRAPYHMEGGRSETSKVAHFQLRPDPLAR